MSSKKMKLNFLEIGKTYRKNPYHNFKHGLVVGNVAWILEWTPFSKISPLKTAWFFHDSDHTGIKQADDEERAAEIAAKRLTDWGFDRDFIHATREAIMWTIFERRGELYLPQQKLLADADLSSLWSWFKTYLEQAIRLLLELNPQWVSDDDIITFFTNTQVNFYHLLTDITQDANNPFLTQEASIKYPHFSRNKDKLAELMERSPIKIIRLVRKMEKEQTVKDFKKAA